MTAASSAATPASIISAPTPRANGRWKGQILNQEHTPAKGENPVFGGHEVGIGFSGTCDEEGALLEATALAGKRSLRLTAVLKLMRRA